MKLKRYQSGFTLIELLVVISIIALIVSAALLLLNSSRQKSRNAARLADIQQIRKGLDVFQLNCNSYPNQTSVTINSTLSLYTGSTVGCGAKDGSSSANGGFGLVANAAGTVIVRTLKAAPLPADGATCATGTNNSYIYNTTDSGSTYTITFCLGSATGDYPAGVRTANQTGIQ